MEPRSEIILIARSNSTKHFLLTIDVGHKELIGKGAVLRTKPVPLRNDVVYEGIVMPVPMRMRSSVRATEAIKLKSEVTKHLPEREFGIEINPTLSRITSDENIMVLNREAK